MADRYNIAHHTEILCTKVCYLFVVLSSIASLVQGKPARLHRRLHRMFLQRSISRPFRYVALCPVLEWALCSGGRGDNSSWCCLRNYREHFHKGQESISIVH